MQSIYKIFNQVKRDKELQKGLVKTSIITIILMAIFFYLGLEIKEANFLTQTNVLNFVNSFGYFSWVAYVLLLVIAIMSPLPDSPIVLTGGYLFGPWVAIPLTIFGQLIGATVNFFLARKLGRSFVNRKFPKASNLLNEYSHKLGWQTVFVMRLTPTLSFDLLSYAAGLSPIKYIQYILATLAGMIPLMIMTTILGYSASIKSKTLPFIVLSIGALFIISTLFIFKKIHKNKSA